MNHTDGGLRNEGTALHAGRRMRHRMRTWLLIAASLPVVLAAGAANPSTDPTPQRIGDDIYSAGRQVAVDTEVPGDAMAAGGRVALSGRVGGDAVAAGGAVTIASRVGHDVYAAGGEVRITGTAGGNARLAGGRVTIGPTANIAGGVTIAGGRVTLDGHVRRHALVRAGRTEVNGRIDGDLRVTGGELFLGPNAVVQGRLDYRGTAPPHFARGAQVQGGVAEIATPSQRRLLRGVLVVWLIGTLVAGVALLALAPRASRRVTQALRASPVASPLLGMALIAGLPLAALLLMITVIGIPLGALALLVLMALILLGSLTTAAAIGDALVERRGPARMWQRALATALALLILFALGQLPYVGGVVWLLALLFGAGAIGLAGWRARRIPAAPAM